VQVLSEYPHNRKYGFFSSWAMLISAAIWGAAFAGFALAPSLWLALGLLGIAGIYARQVEKAGWMGLAGCLAATMGFDRVDVDVITRVVRLHLLLPNVATRRDVDDPVTVAHVAAAIGDVTTLDLLYALCRADAVAAGPSATSPWKARLTAALVRNVRGLLADGALPVPAYPELGGALAGATLPAVEVTGTHVTVAALDRRGLLAAVAGVLAVHRLDVVGADTATVEGRAVVRIGVEPRYGGAPDRDHLAAELRQAALGELPPERLARIGAARRGGPRATVTEPTVTWHTGAATDAVVLELRAADAPALLHRVTGALAEAGVDVRAARVATLGGDVVDAFYLGGARPDEPERARIAAAVLTAAGARAPHHPAR
jgi:[protein-PII] uridylyltransferase